MHLAHHVGFRPGSFDLLAVGNGSSPNQVILRRMPREVHNALSHRGRFVWVKSRQVPALGQPGAVLAVQTM